jgi:hypothetical protein
MHVHAEYCPAHVPVCQTPTTPAMLAIVSIATYHCAVSATARACFPDAKRFCRKHGKNHGAVLSCLRYVDMAALLWSTVTSTTCQANDVEPAHQAAFHSRALNRRKYSDELSEPCHAEVFRTQQDVSMQPS